MSSLNILQNRLRGIGLKVVAVVPMKLNNSRLPQKNTKPFTNGEPLCTYILNTLKSIEEIDEIYVFCSNPEIKEFLPDNVKYLKRSEELDTDVASMTDVLTAFSEKVDADVYVMTHTTAPFISGDSLKKGLNKVVSGENDSSFAAEKIQDFLWEKGKPMNYDLNRIPRTQDLEPLYMETSGFYIYTREVMKEKHRRIGDNPYIVEVNKIEGIDIDEFEDFQMADAIFNYRKNYSL